VAPAGWVGGSVGIQVRQRGGHPLGRRLCGLGRRDDLDRARQPGRGGSAAGLVGGGRERTGQSCCIRVGSLVPGDHVGGPVTPRDVGLWLDFEPAAAAVAMHGTVTPAMAAVMKDLGFLMCSSSVLPTKLVPRGADAKPSYPMRIIAQILRGLNWSRDHTREGRRSVTGRPSVACRPRFEHLQPGNPRRDGGASGAGRI